MVQSGIPIPPTEPGPAWEIARLFPDQGQWGEGDYFELNRSTNRFVEFSDGRVEVLDMPTRSHQRIVLYLRDAVEAVVKPGRIAEVLVAPYPVRLREGKFREPDLVCVLAEHAARMGEDYADGADLVMEVVSEDRHRDLTTKRDEYEQARIPEYWIVDRQEQRITVLYLSGGQYTVFSEGGPSERVRSALLPGLEVSVDAVLAAALGS